MNSLFASISLDNRDISYDPSKGWFASERLTWYGLIPGLEKEFFLKSETKLEGYLTLFDVPLTEDFNLKGVLAAYTGTLTFCLFRRRFKVDEIRFCRYFRPSKRR